MPRFKLLIEYAGTRYSGWQIQKNARTVQGEIDRAIRAVTGTGDFELSGAGRTDAGVHALGQVAHLELRTSLPSDTLARRINDELPSDINVLAVEKAPHRFHARHDAVSRSYLYQIARRRTALAKPFVWWVKADLDIAAMRRAARVFVGRQDFRSFTDADPDETSTLVEVEALTIEEQGDLVLVRIEGSHFLWKMVRRIVGVLVEVGSGGLRIDEAAEMLRRRSPTPARLTAPASGLFLECVHYAGDVRGIPVQPALTLALARPAGSGR